VGGRPYWRKKAMTASQLVSAWSSAPGWAARQDRGARIEEVEHLHHMRPLADRGSAGALLASDVPSICTSSKGSRGSNGWRLRSGASVM